MADEHKQLRGKRVVYMHAKLWEAAKLAQLYARSQRGRKAEYNFLHALVDAAFALEAYLNFLGPKHCVEWEGSPGPGFRDRLRAVGRSLNVTVNFGDAPYCDIARLIEARNSLAHARVESIEFSRDYFGALEDEVVKNEPIVIEKLCTDKESSILLDAVERCVEELHKASGEPLHPLYVKGHTGMRSRDG